MASAAELFKAGELDRALEALQAEVRRSPGDSRLRAFLAELLFVLGQWDRAVTQLDVLGKLDAAALPMVHACRAAIHCESERRAVFSGLRTPLVFGEPPAWIALLVQALALDRDGHVQNAAALREEAFAAAEPVAGTLNGAPFAWLADADSRLGPVMELFLDGKYYWAPVQRIRRVTFEAPQDARDLVWAPGQFTWENGGQAVAFVPVRYVGSEDIPDVALRLGRKTEWRELSEASYAGAGQRVLATDVEELGLLDVRELSIGEGA